MRSNTYFAEHNKGRFVNPPARSARGHISINSWKSKVTLAELSTVDPPNGRVSLEARPVDITELPTTIIQPRPGWKLVDFRELWRYRELLIILTWRDIAVRYKQTVLGAAW